VRSKPIPSTSLYTAAATHDVLPATAGVPTSVPTSVPSSPSGERQGRRFPLAHAHTLPLMPSKNNSFLFFSLSSQQQYMAAPPPGYGPPPPGYPGGYPQATYAGQVRPSGTLGLTNLFLPFFPPTCCLLSAPAVNLTRPLFPSLHSPPLSMAVWCTTRHR